MNFGRRFALFAALSAVVCQSQWPVHAQDNGDADPNAPPVAVSPTPKDGTQGLTLSTFLNALDYNPAERGALLLIGPNQPYTSGRVQLPAGPLRRIALGTVARLFQRKSSTLGSVTVLAPTTMKIIETNPGKADPLAGMKPADVLKLLMGSFTQDQWKIASDENGIGFSDLTTEQAQLYDHLLPTEIRVQKSTVAEGANTGTVTFGDVQMITVQDRSSVRIRFNRETSIALHSKSESGVWMGGNAMNYQTGDSVVQLLPSRSYGSDVGGEERASTAFGVLLLHTVTNRQKPSDLDYSSPALDARISLHDLGAKPKIGPLIARVSAATHLHFVADFRVRDLPIYVRGDEARAGDILQAITLGVTGTFRKVGTPPIFLLTDDIEGIGARLTRLEFWASQAEGQRFKLLMDAKSRAAKQNPLEFLKFGAGDKLALSADAQKKIDDRYRDKPHWDLPDQKTEDLPPALKDQVNRDIELWRTQENVSLDPTKVTIGMQLSTCFVIPNIGTVKDVFASLSGGPTNLQDLVDVTDEAPNVPAKGTPAAVSTWLASPSPRRILLAAPTSAAEATRLVGEAQQRGFNELWVRVKLDGGPDAPAILRAAQAAHKLPIFAVVSLLHGGGAQGKPELTILGQTGAEFAADYVSGKAADVPAWGIEKPEEKNLLVVRHYSDWIQPDRGELIQRIGEIAAIPNLLGLAVEGTTPPGFSKDIRDFGQFVLTGGALGYTEPRRAALIASKGLDPIDVRVKTRSLGVNLTLPFFPDDSQSRRFTEINGQLIEDMSTQSPQEIWDGALYKENETLLSDVYHAIRSAHPTLPLFIDDRTSDFVSANTGWFGSWDSATALPKNDIYGDPATAPAIAHLRSKTLLLKESVPDLDTSADPYAFAAFLADLSSKANSSWNGLIADLTPLPFARTLETLGTISGSGKQLSRRHQIPAFMPACLIPARSGQ